MPAPNYGIQSSFSGGEFSPALYARVDIQKYLTGLKTARNVNILPQGGVRNRPGTAYVATARDSTNPVRLIPFTYSTTQAFILEFGQSYIRFYTNDGQILSGGVPYQISSPYQGADLVNLKFTQSANFLYITHPNYAPMILARITNTNWTLTNLNFINGPFMLQNVVSANTVLPAAPAWATATAYFTGQYVFAGGLTAADKIDDFSEGNYNLWTAPAFASEISVVNSHLVMQNTIADYPYANYRCVYKALAATYGSFTAKLGPGSMMAFNLNASTVDSANFPNGHGYIISLSPNGTSINLYRTDGTTNGFQIGIATGAVVTLASINAPISGEHHVTVFRHASDGVFTIYVDGVAATPVTDNTYTSGSYIFLIGNTYQRQATCQITNIYYDSANTAQNNGVNSANYICLIPHSSGTFSTDLANGLWQLSNVIGGPGITLSSSSSIFQSGHVGSLFNLVYTLVAQTLTDTGFSANTHISSVIPCGATWSLITLGTWSGKILVQTSVDGGNTWQTVQTLQANSTNFTVTGDTGFSQCLLRVAGDTTVTWSGTATIDLTANSFDWSGVVIIDSVANGFNAVAHIQNNEIGNPFLIGGTTPTFQWSFGSWSTQNGWPACCAFFQDRLVLASTVAEPQTAWFSQVSDYQNFGVSEPVVDSDAISVVLPARQANVIRNLVVLQTLIVLTSDSEFSISVGQNGILAPSSIQIQLQGHRGTANPDPVIVGIEMILLQQMGTIVRNFIFQLAVNQYMGDNISINSQHLFTGYQIVAMAYAQEPDSLLWAVRSDGALLSLTYMREQEMCAWTRHDTLGSYISVATIPNSTLGINEVWFAVNRTINGVNQTFIERMMPRDQGIVPSAQWFVDAGLTYNGAPATVITGLSYLNGQYVSILADGNVVPQQLVIGGQIVLPVAASIVRHSDDLWNENRRAASVSTNPEARTSSVSFFLSLFLSASISSKTARLITNPFFS